MDALIWFHCPVCGQKRGVLERRVGMKPYQHIRKYIEDRGLKFGYIAKEAGYSKQTLSAMLNGKRKIYIDDVIKLCKVLGAQPNDLIVLDEDSEVS